MWSGKTAHWGIIACSGCAFLLFGYDQGVMSGLLTGPDFQATFRSIATTGEYGKPENSKLQGTVVALYEIGCFFGALFTFFGAGDLFGRRKMIWLGCTVLIIGTVIQTASYSVAQLTVGRIITGVGTGINTSTIPVWVSETSHSHNRGRNVTLECAILICGIMIAYWMDYGLSYVPGSIAWRLPIAFQIVFAMAAMVLLIWLPESPRWLLAKDRNEEARKVLTALSAAPAGPEREEILRVEYEDIMEGLRLEREAVPLNAKGQPISPLRACFSRGPERYLRRTLLAMGSQFMQQMSGINLITYYAPVIFETSIGLDHNLSLLLAGFNGVAYFISSLIPIFFVERLGRRKLMLFSAIGQAITMAVLAGCTSVTATAPGIVAAVCLFVFNFFFACGFLPLPWLLPTEYAPLPIRAPVAALSTATDWIFNFVVVEIVPVSITNIGYRTYVYFAVFNACFVPLIYFFYPETAKLTLEECDDLFTMDPNRVFLHWPEDRPRAITADLEQGGAEKLRQRLKNGGRKGSDDGTIVGANADEKKATAAVQHVE